MQPLLLSVERTYAQRQDGLPNDRLKDWPGALIPMPIHPERRRIRGFNQAHLIADRIGRRFDLPVHGEAVVRSGSSESQSELTAVDRRKSLKNAFEVKQTLPRHVVIVDDVMTTGSSADALAHALKRSGVLRVSVWVLARTPAPGDMPN
jgi:Predicted amidophosphoribosyltransferases